MIRMIDIAQKAGVSRSTVSFILNGAPQAEKIRQEVRDKVLNIAEELGYQPNQIAKSMISGKTKVIGLVSDLPQHEHLSLILAGILTACEEHDYFIKFMNKSSDEKTLIKKIRGQRLDGVIINHYPLMELDSLIEKLTQHRIPIAVVANSFQTKNGIRVVSDDQQGGMLAIEHFVQNGHRKIAFIGSNENSYTLNERRIGYFEGMKKYCPTEKVNNISIDSASIESLIKVIEENPETTAYFCPWPVLAVNLIKASRRIKKRMPKDISVIAYSNSQLTRHFDPPITTIDQHHREMGYSAAMLLIKAMKDSDTTIFDTATTKTLPASLVVGETVSYRR